MNQFKLKVKNVIEKGRFKLKGRDQGIHVLTYHGLVETRSHPRLQRNFHTTDEFWQQLKALKKSGAKIFSPREFDEELENKTIFNTKKAFLLTFDDGYRNNLKAAEILSEVNLEAAFFISTGTIGSKESVWTVNLSLLLLCGSLKSIQYRSEEILLGSEEERNRAFNRIRYALKACTGEERVDAYQTVIQQYPNGELETLVDNFSCFKMMTEKEITELSDSGQSVQSHGVMHELFNRNQSNDVVKNELFNSKRRLESITKKPVTWFAYPNGDDQQPESDLLLQESGYNKAFALGYRSFLQKDNLFHIPRYNASQSSTKLLF